MKKQKWLIAVLWLGVGGLSAVSPLHAAGYRMPITFGGYSNRTAVLTNFPVLVVLSNNVGSSGLTMGSFVSTNGWDLRFRDAGDTTNLNYEIESWNTNGASYVWVQVPTIPTNGGGSVWATWGNDGDSSQLACTTNGAVWDANFNGVWHFGDAGPTYAADSTTNANRGTQSGGVTFGGAGKVGRAASFDGVNDYINAGPVHAGSAANGITLSTWVYTSSGDFDGTVRSIVADNNGDPNTVNGFFLLLDDRATTPIVNGLINAFDTANTSLRATKVSNVIGATPGWYHLVSSYSPSAGLSYLYVNGVEVGVTILSAGTGNFIPDNNTVLCFGALDDGTLPLKGLLDECRVSKISRSADWSYAEYLNMASNGVFNLYGPAAQIVAGAPVIVADSATDITTISATLNGTLTTNGASTEVYVLWGPEQKGATMEGWAYTNYFGTNTLDTPRGYATNTSFTAALTPGTSYFYRYHAVNATTGTWSGPITFTAWQTPAVNNSAGAADITTVSALLRGTVTAGVPTPDVYFCLKAGSEGTADTGTWDRVISVGTASGAVAAPATGLTLSTLYWYRAYATNAVTNAWAPAASSFTTLALRPFNLASNHTVNGGVTLVGTNPAVELPAASLGGASWLYEFGPYGCTNLNLGGCKIATDNGDSITLNLGGGDMIGTATSVSLDTHNGDTSGGAVVVTNVHDVTIGPVQTYTTKGLYGGGYGGGTITIGSAAAPAGNVTIAGLDSRGLGYPSDGRSVAINGGNVRIRHGTTDDDILTTANAGISGGAVSVASAGSFSVRDIATYGYNENYARGADVTLNGASGGTCTIRDLLTYTTRSARGGHVVVSGYSSVSIRAIDTHGSEQNAGNRGAGNVVITNIAGAIAISSNINLYCVNNAYHGYLNLQAGGSITLTNLDLTWMAYAALNANDASYITGLLTGTNGVAASGLANIGTALRTPLGKSIRYWKKANPAMGGQHLTLADVSGTPGAGGRLVPWPAEGTGIFFR
jgi:hypothetical protein